MLFHCLRKERIRDQFLCVNGFDTIEQNYPYLCKFDFKSVHAKPETKNYPNEILPNQMYLGDQFHAGDARLMKNMRITHVVNCTAALPNFFIDAKSDPKIQYHQIKVEDEEGVDLKKHFQEAFEFIDKALGKKASFTKRNTMNIDKLSRMQSFEIKKETKATVVSCGYAAELEIDFSEFSTKFKEKNLESKIFDTDRQVARFQEKFHNRSKIFVHCAMGRSRSATIVIMYLMRKFKMRLEDAIKMAKIRRDAVDPNPGFLKQLSEFSESGCEFTSFFQEGVEELKEEDEY